MRVLAISGFKRSGKDTLADYLVNRLGANRVSFAGPLKDKVAKDFNFPRDWCDNPEFKEKPILTMPVNPQDDFTRMVTKFMYKEFRDLECRQPVGYGYDPSFVGAFEDGNYKTLYHTPRSLCILEGSTKRVADSTYWVKQAIEVIKTNKSALSVVTDMRYKSEANQLKEAFGDNLLTVRVNRFDTSPSSDPSERDLDDYQFDHIIDNKGTLEEFYNKIDELMKKL